MRSLCLTPLWTESHSRIWLEGRASQAQRDRPKTGQPKNTTKCRHRAIPLFVSKSYCCQGSRASCTPSPCKVRARARGKSIQALRDRSGRKPDSQRKRRSVTIEQYRYSFLNHIVANDLGQAALRRHAMFGLACHITAGLSYGSTAYPARLSGFPSIVNRESGSVSCWQTSRHPLRASNHVRR